MKRWKNDFTNSTKSHPEAWYDIREDWPLIEASIASQYGIRLRQASDMSWSEFSNLVTGLLPETPLGAIVKIRSEDDPKVLEKFTKDQLEIRNKWRNRQALQQLDNPDLLEAEMNSLSKMLESMFGDK